jgi:hypothetical protein
LSVDKAAVLDALLGGLPDIDWRVAPGTVHNERTWDERLDRAAAFVQQHDRLPTTRETALGSNGEVDHVGKWLLEQRMRLRDGKLAAVRAHELDRQLAGWQSQRG